MTVPVGAGGAVSTYNGAGQVDVVFDVQGWYGPNDPAMHDGLFNAIAPARLLDTRSNGGPLGPGQTRNLIVVGRGVVPTSGVAAVALNVTVTNPTASSYLSVFPAGAPRPSTSTLNFVAGQQLPNRVIVPVGAGGQVSFYNALGQVQVVVDVSGWFTDSASTAGGSRFTTITPQRILDTRAGFGTFEDSGIATVQMADTLSLGVTAVMANFTIANATAPSYLTVWPGGTAQPTASDLNYAGGQTVANLVIARLNGGGFNLYNAWGEPNLVIDLVGYYGPVGA